MIPQPTLEQMRHELRVSAEFLDRYNRPGPRYTSYPTAPVWNDVFGPRDLEAVHGAADAARTPVSLYMHLPFCESLCLFCACNVIIQKDKRVSIPYFDVLKKEITRIGESVSSEREVVQFHWGGGTPTYSTPAQLEDLFGYTKERFTFSPEAEIGIEVDPRVTSREHLETLRRLGFNRLSMGIQDFHEPVQQAIHRIQPYEITRDLIQAARDLGFDSLNVDLMDCHIRPRRLSRKPLKKLSGWSRIALRFSAMRTSHGLRNSKDRSPRICRTACRNLRFSGRGC